MTAADAHMVKFQCPKCGHELEQTIAVCTPPRPIESLACIPIQSWAREPSGIASNNNGSAVHSRFNLLRFICGFSKFRRLMDIRRDLK